MGVIDLLWVHRVRVGVLLMSCEQRGTTENFNWKSPRAHFGKELMAFLLPLSVKDLHSHLPPWDQGLGQQHATPLCGKQAEVQPKGHSASATTDTGQGKVIPSHCLGKENPSCSLPHRGAKMLVGGVGAVGVESHCLHLCFGFPFL